MKVVLAQINPIVGDFDGNCAKIAEAIGTGDLVIFPELALCGYPPDDLLFHRDFQKEMDKRLDQLIELSANTAFIVGLARVYDGKLYNSAALIENQKLLGFQDKRLLPNYDVFYEQRYFTAGKQTLIWKIAKKKVAVTICEDIWEEEPVISDLEKERFDLLVNLSSSPFYPGRQERRLELCTQISKKLDVPLLYCNQVGGNDSLIFDGHSLCVGEGIRKVAAGFKEEHFVVDLNKKEEVSFAFDLVHDLHDALVLGIRDYFHKQGFEKAIVGLSGGIDSAVTACLAKEALGDVLALSLPSRFSSEGSVVDAQNLARVLGLEWKLLNIDPLFNTFLEALEPFMEGKAHDATEENLQARIRGTLLMAFANKHGHLLLSPGNKSEMAMGYTTLYGDLCGGLGVLSDVSKAQVYELAAYINRDLDIIPRTILTKPPSAELRPNQKDSDTLPEYDIVDAVLERYVEGFQTVEEIAVETKIPLSTVKTLVQKIHNNEFKRRQAPPGLRVSKKAFTAGWRFPIVHKWNR
ncbi:MAG: NAD+ synthase [Chlamydiales bacterium]|nr:NAD+ synthase [Chlamydiales bacterium]